jgi:hypothetical protein
MSADLPPIATEERTFRIGSFVPGSDICSAAKSRGLFDHLVGGREQFRRHGDGFGGAVR